jgi:nucleoside-diphosphate-sugar epimerase
MGHLIQAVKKAPHLKRFVFASTTEVYGSNAWGREDSPPHPTTPYGLAMHTAEQLGLAHAESDGLPFVTLRFSPIYGPRQRPDMPYHQFFQALIEDRPFLVSVEATEHRGHTFVLDCVAALVSAVRALPGEIYNVSSEEFVSSAEVLKLLEKVTGRRSRTRLTTSEVAGQHPLPADSTKIGRHLGWRAKTKLADGLAAQWRWHCDQIPPKPLTIHGTNFLTPTLNTAS